MTETPTVAMTSLEEGAIYNSNIPFIYNIETFGMPPYGEAYFIPDNIEFRREEAEWDPCLWGLPDERGLPLKPIAQIEKEITRKHWNRRRGLGISRQVKQNAIIQEACYDWMRKRPIQLTSTETEFFLDFTRRIDNCCHHSLFRDHKDGTKEFIGAHTCKHKLCTVCNAQRSKRTRRIWRRFFEKNPELLHEYDFMHLTLTVPHDQQGWRGQKWYASELMKQFNWMRKKTFWKRHVYGGEFGVEATRNKKGFHIHIHSLLLVHKSRQNRNELHKEILKAWNAQTAGSSQRQSFSEEDITAICKGNKLMSRIEAEHLDPTGATLIGLESLYITSKEAKPGYIWCKRSETHKRYVKPTDGQDIFLAGIMECIKYHFEPMAMLDNGSYDFEMLREILPAIKGKPLYRKFGAFHASTKNAHVDAKMLSFNYKSDKEEILADLEATGREEITHPETGEPVTNEDFTYFLVSMTKVFFDPDDDYKIKLSKYARPIPLHVRSCIEAIETMEMIAARGGGDHQIPPNTIIHQPKIQASCLN